jgi:hypothetical protein
LHPYIPVLFLDPVRVLLHTRAHGCPLVKLQQKERTWTGIFPFCTTQMTTRRAGKAIGYPDPVACLVSGSAQQEENGEP